MTNILIIREHDTDNTDLERAIQGHREKARICKPRRKASGETKPE